MTTTPDNASDPSATLTKLVGKTLGYITYRFVYRWQQLEHEGDHSETPVASEGGNSSR